jgi:hypothetical protein
MNRRHPALILALVSVGWLAACSRENTAAAETAAASGPADDPCTIVTDKQVHQVLGQTKPGKRDHSVDQYGIATCKWETSTNTLVVQIFRAKGTVEDELRSRASGVIDPMKPGAGKNVRYEKVPHVGDETMIAAEKGDESQGLFSDIAALVSRRGDRMAVLFMASLVDGDRAATLKALEDLGGKAAARL